MASILFFISHMHKECTGIQTILQTLNELCEERPLITISIYISPEPELMKQHNIICLPSIVVYQSDGCRRIHISNVYNMYHIHIEQIIEYEERLLQAQNESMGLK